MIDVLREHCLAKKEVSESFPFDENTLVFKVYDKMFALISLEREPLQMNLKCEPEKAIELREEYYQVITGYHSNKKHWNTIVLENISVEFVKKWIDHSYELVWQKLPKKIKQ